MPFGYSYAFVMNVTEKYKNKPKEPLYQLGYLAVKHNIMPSEIAERLGVSKQAYYKWFEGAYKPAKDVSEKIVELNKELKALNKKRK